MRVVKIKTWNRMEQEYGLCMEEMSEETSINTKSLFTKSMEESLPKNRIIKIYENIWAPNKHTRFNIDKEMIEKEFNSKDYPQYFI